MAQARLKGGNRGQAISPPAHTLLGRSSQEPTLSSEALHANLLRHTNFARLGLKAFPFAAMLLATSSAALAANEPDQAAKTEACAAIMVASRCRKDSARPYSPTISVMHGTWPSAPMVSSTSTPGAALLRQRYASAWRIPGRLAGIDGDGQADVVARFGDTLQQGRRRQRLGIYKGALYAEVNGRIVRYA